MSITTSRHFRHSGTITFIIPLHPWYFLCSQPVLLLQLLLQLCHFSLQGSDGGLELGLDLVLHVLELGFQLLVLALHLLPGALVLLGGGALSLQLIVQLIHL